MNVIKKTALYFARKKFCRAAIDERADLSAILEKPTVSIIIGIILIGFSYVIGLPTALGIGAIVGQIKGPRAGSTAMALIYAISTIIFLIGIKMAGKKYFIVFLKWMVRVVLEKILGEDARTIPEAVSDNKSLQS